MRTKCIRYLGKGYNLRLISHSPITSDKSRSTLPISNLYCLCRWGHKGTIIYNEAVVSTHVACMFKLEPGCKLDKGCNLHISLEEGLITERILKVPESYDVVLRNIIFIPLHHRIDPCITISDECNDME